jgi:hypothetical protein
MSISRVEATSKKKKTLHRLVDVLLSYPEYHRNLLPEPSAISIL